MLVQIPEQPTNISVDHIGRLIIVTEKVEQKFKFMLKENIVEQIFLALLISVVMELFEFLRNDAIVVYTKMSEGDFFVYWFGKTIISCKVNI